MYRFEVSAEENNGHMLLPLPLSSASCFVCMSFSSYHTPKTRWYNETDYI